MSLLTGCLNILLFYDWSSLCHLLSVLLLSCSSDVPTSKYTVTWKYNILNYYKYNIINMLSIDHKFVFIFLTVFPFSFLFVLSFETGSCYVVLAGTFSDPASSSLVSVFQEHILFTFDIVQFTSSWSLISSGSFLTSYQMLKFFQ